MARVVVGHECPPPGSARRVFMAPVSDPGIERSERDSVASAADTESKVERRLQDAAMTYGDNRLIGVVRHDPGQGSAGANEKAGPAFPAGREGAERVRLPHGLVEP